MVTEKHLTWAELKIQKTEQVVNENLIGLTPSTLNIKWMKQKNEEWKEGEQFFWTKNKKKWVRNKETSYIET